MSAMSELATALDGATRCATIGCKGAPTALLVWRHDGVDCLDCEDNDCPRVNGDPEAVCSQCGAGYARRPWVMARADFLPGPDFDLGACPYLTGDWS